MEPLVQAAPLTDGVTTQLRVAILNGDFAPGEKIRQADVARQLQVSRGPVREALRSLIAEGLVYEEPRRGTFVVELGPEDVREIFDVRVALEVRAAHLVIADGNSEATISAMGSALDEMIDGLERGDAAKVSAGDMAFHSAHVAGSGNRRLMRLYAVHSEPVRLLLRMDNRHLLSAEHGGGDELVQEHRQILALLQDGDPDQLGRALARHIEDARDRLIAALSGTA